MVPTPDLFADPAVVSELFPESRTVLQEKVEIRTNARTKFLTIGVGPVETH